MLLSYASSNLGDLRCDKRFMPLDSGCIAHCLAGLDNYNLEAASNGDPALNTEIFITPMSRSMVIFLTSRTSLGLQRKHSIHVKGEISDDAAAHHRN